MPVGVASYSYANEGGAPPTQPAVLVNLLLDFLLLELSNTRILFRGILSQDVRSPPI